MADDARIEAGSTGDVGPTNNSAPVATPAPGKRRRRRTSPSRATLASLAQIDQRTMAARRMRALRDQLESDLGGDLTAAQRELVQRASALGALLEHHEAGWLAMGTIELEPYIACARTQQRLLSVLGLERRARDVRALSVEEYAELCRLREAAERSTPDA